jgi:hypothetical protein
MIKNANYFKLNKEPLKEWDLNINLTLKDSLEKEERDNNKSLNNNNKSNKQNINYIIKNKGKQLKINKTIKDDNNNNISISEKKENIEKYEKIPKLNLTNINRIDNNNNKKRSKKKIKFSILCSKNTLLYSNSTKTCSRYEKHCRMNNLTDREFNPRIRYRKSTYILRNNIKHIQRFENKKSQKTEFAETQNLLNEIKSNYMKKYHEKVTQDNIIKNKNLLNDTLQTNIKSYLRRMKTTRYIKIANQDHILLSKRLWRG